MTQYVTVWTPRQKRLCRRNRSGVGAKLRDRPVPRRAAPPGCADPGSAKFFSLEQTCMRNDLTLKQRRHGKMPSVYKSIQSHSHSLHDPSDSDMADLSGSDRSSGTLHADSDTDNVSVAAPLELKNRVLMLTTRGVSHR